ncbi:MAG TPA: hypothetical protein VGK67_27705 [Myxococcales bacterium]|jgi:hypothetical protein
MRPLLRLALLACALASSSGCASVVLRFPQDVAASFAREDMRRMETAHLQLYYPAAHQEAATNIAARLEQCTSKLRAMEKTQRPRDKLLVFLTSSDFNNAYVQPVVLGLPQQMVLPVHLTLDLFDLYDIGTNAVGDVSCHEAVHYMTFEQVEGFWRGLNAVTGGLLTPQSFLDTWVHEGMATYYEARLGKPVGRPFSPYWRGAFAAGVASEESLDPGFLNSEQRLQNPYGPAYLSGMQFVEYLARTYGEDKLWQLVDKQGNSIFSPIGLTLRFKSVYGQSIGALFDDFVKETKEREAKRKRPEGQRVLAADVGTSARLAAAPDGTLASVSSGRDEPARLIIRERDGRVRASRRLANVLPFRKTIVSSPTAFSGLSFSPDGRWLYLVGADLDSVGSFVSKLWQVDASDGSLERIVADDLTGVGGCATSDGAGYVYVQIASDRASLVRLDLKDGRRTTLWQAPPATSITAPACSPDGARVAFARRGERGLDLSLLQADGSVTALTEDGRYNTTPRWLDAGHLVFLREEAGRSQAFVMDVATKTLWPTTDAPFGAIDPAPLGQEEIAFLNRDGWGLSLDATKLERVPSPQAARTAEAPPPPADLEAGFLASAAGATDPRETAPGALPTRVEPVPPLQVESDEPYSPIDHLFVPSLRIPFLAIIPPGLVDTTDKNWRLLVALSLYGSDRLGKHNWAINLSYDTKDNGPSASVTYANYQLAPWLIDVNGALVNLGPAYDRFAQLGASREFWTTPLRLQFTGIDHHDLSDDGREVVGQYRFVGPGLQFAYAAAESTPYGGIRRGLAFAASGDWYPKFASSAFDLGDVAAEVDVWIPLPISRRHSLAITGRGRALIASEQHRLLDVGGLYGGTPLFTWSPQGLVPKLRASDLQLFGAPELTFSEALRGYPDLTTSASAFAAGSASYVYPFIIDHGWASLLYVLPAFFVRQIDLELFGEMAWLWPGTIKRRSAGLAVHLRTSVGNLPLSLFLEGAWRFDADRGPLLVLGFSLL